VTVARPQRWSTTLRSQPTSYTPKPSAGLCGDPVACQSLSFRFLRRDPSDGLLTGHAPGLFPDRIDKRRMCWPARWLIFGETALAAAHDAAAFRRIGCPMWPRGSPHRTNERLVVNLLGRSKRRHWRATTFRSANFSGTQIFESNLIGPCRYAREVAEQSDRRSPNGSTARPSSACAPTSRGRGPSPRRLTLFSFCSMLGQGWQRPKREHDERAESPVLSAP
jgi:hypothetical protein